MSKEKRRKNRRAFIKEALKGKWKKKYSSDPFPPLRLHKTAKNIFKKMYINTFLKNSFSQFLFGIFEEQESFSSNNEMKAKHANFQWANAFTQKEYYP